MANDKNESEPGGEGEPLAPIDFSTFVMSLATSVMVNLGRMQTPEGTPGEKDLPAAQQIIDILGILKEKTNGNLSDQEEKLLTSLLTDLRIQFLDAQKH